MRQAQLEHSEVQLEESTPGLSPYLPEHKLIVKNILAKGLALPKKKIEEKVEDYQPSQQ